MRPARLAALLSIVSVVSFAAAPSRAAPENTGAPTPPATVSPAPPETAPAP